MCIWDLGLEYLGPSRLPGYCFVYMKIFYFNIRDVVSDVSKRNVHMCTECIETVP